jgi:hypothetical protein
MMDIVCYEPWNQKTFSILDDQKTLFFFHNFGQVHISDASIKTRGFYNSSPKNVTIYKNTHGKICSRKFLPTHVVTRVFQKTTKWGLIFTLFSRFYLETSFLTIFKPQVIVFDIRYTIIIRVKSENIFFPVQTNFSKFTEFFCFD